MYGYYGYYMDPTYVLVILALLLSMFASFGVKSTFSKYDKVRNSRGVTGADAARQILNRNGLYNVRIERVSGSLTDHFDPKTNVVRLSDSTYSSTSVAAVGVAAHECGHAVQYSVGYAPIRLRNSMVPAVNFGNSLAMPLFLIGLILGITGLEWAGIILFSLALIFQLVTLPVEFNASRRALGIIKEHNILYEDEYAGAKRVLTAAAMTYVASVASTALQLLRLVLLANRRSRR